MARSLPFLGIALIALIAAAPIAHVHAATQTITIDQNKTFDNITIAITGTITVDTTAKTITGSISVKAVNNTSGQILFQNTFNININYGMTSNFLLAIPTLSGMLAASCFTSATSASCMVSKTPDVNHHGIVDITDIATLASAYGTRNTTLDLDGDGTVDFLDLTLAAADFGAPVLFF